MPKKDGLILRVWRGLTDGLTRRQKTGCLFTLVVACALVEGAAAGGYWGFFSVGIVSISLFLTNAMFMSAEPVVVTYQRPAGQMVIATVLNLMVATGLSLAAIVMGGVLSISDAKALATAGTVFVIQGIALTFYVWWRWFSDGDADLQKHAQSASMVGPYSEADWRRDMQAAAPLQCPDCGHAENFGPKLRGTPAHHYRACKVCGFWQDADGVSAPFHCRMTVHVCLGVFANPRECQGCGTSMAAGVKWHLCARILAPGESWRCPECEMPLLEGYGVPWAVKRL